MKAFAPKRRFSQNFLTDPRTADAIVQALEIHQGDHVLEIGPGTGMLTQRLAASQAKRIVAVDVDPRAIQHIKAAQWASGGRVEAVESDILRMSLDDVFPGVDPAQVKVIGNIPYAITSDILFWAFQARRSMACCVMMMQREVARRCVASCGTKEYGILAIATWYASKPSLLFHVKPGSFFPAPTVTSSVVRFAMREADPLPLAMNRYMDFVRAAFGQRRKVISNGIDAYCRTTWGIGVKQLLAADLPMPIDPRRRRAEELTPEQIHELWRTLEERAEQLQ
ncbi:MAG: ribosomal RNA small subunit methyltransferase A [Candidatus Kapabacteria bacterium]|nr:ribosomal RNA small subunit methyltransferase A [Candidatus Kapabacteria bacterium]